MMNYNTLRNKPTINYRELIGDSTVSEAGGITEEEFNTLINTDLASYYTKAQIDELFARSFVYREKSGPIVTFDCPESTTSGITEVVSDIVAVQAGSGDPSPTNVRPISGWSAVNVYDTNKNMFDPSSIAQGTYDSTTNVWTIGTPTASKAFDFAFKPNTQYTFSGKAKQSVENKNMRFVVFYTDSSYDALWASNLTDEITFNVTSDEGKTISSVAVRYSSYGGNLTVTDFQIEVGTSASQYVAPNGTTYTTQLKDGQGNPLVCYGGQLVNENGVQRLDNTDDILDLGSINWNYSNGRFVTGTRPEIKAPANNFTVANVMCSIYKTLTASATENPANDFSIGINRYQNICVRDSRYSDAVDFKTAMSGILLKYEKATPTTIPQDNLSISSQSGTNNIWADSGDVTVTALDKIIQG